jgi:hypothetical protein
MVRASYSRTRQPHLSIQPRELEPAATKFTLQFMLLNTRFTLYPKHLSRAQHTETSLRSPQNTAMSSPSPRQEGDSTTDVVSRFFQTTRSTPASSGTENSQSGIFAHAQMCRIPDQEDG